MTQKFEQDNQPQIFGSNSGIGAGNVVNLQSVGRRKAIAKLTKNYAAMLVHILGQCSLDDGEHYDENDLPMVRALDRSEMRHGAVVTACQFFTALLYVRARWEEPADTDDGLHPFAFRAELRGKNYGREHMGQCRIVVNAKSKRQFAGIEREFANAIFAGLRIEAQNDPTLNEADFWADTFRGFGDADPSGVVLRAAGLVLLDHMPEFRQALAFHASQTV
jgi:hypothetical protein